MSQYHRPKGAENIKINLGVDFPISEEVYRFRQDVAQQLKNALNCCQYDPIGGNVLACTRDALNLAEVENSQEMALRLLIQLGFDDLGEDPDLNEVFSKVKLFTDWFERDIGDAVALR